MIKTNIKNHGGHQPNAEKFFSIGYEGNVIILKDTKGVSVWAGSSGDGDG